MPVPLVWQRLAAVRRFLGHLPANPAAVSILVNGCNRRYEPW
jgi:hypothetical protein